MKQDWRIDPVLILLTFVICFLVGAVILCAFILPNNMAVFVLLSGLITSASGSFYTRMNPKSVGQQEADAQPGSITITKDVPPPADVSTGAR